MGYYKYKGIHPGIILDRELKKRSLKQRPFALSINEHPQTFNASQAGILPPASFRFHLAMDTLALG